MQVLGKLQQWKSRLAPRGHALCFKPALQQLSQRQRRVGTSAYSVKSMLQPWPGPAVSHTGCWPR